MAHNVGIKLHLNICQEYCYRNAILPDSLLLVVWFSNRRTVSCCQRCQGWLLSYMPPSVISHALLSIPNERLAA